VLDPVRPEQLRGGDDRDDQPVRDVGAVVVEEADVEPEDVTVVVETDLDPLHLPAFVVGGDEVLVAVLGVLHLVAQQPGRPRHQHLLRPRVHDLHAEPAADVGGDALDLRERQLEERRDREPHAGGRLGRGVDP
jgi:hypothetical protein